MTAPLVDVIRDVVKRKLGELDGGNTRLVRAFLDNLADEVARNVAQAMMPTVDQLCEAREHLATLLALLDARDFRSAQDQQAIRDAEMFLAGDRA